MMIIPDVGILVAAYNPASAVHPAARSWWEGLLQGGGSVGVPWSLMLGFVRLVGTRGVLPVPAPPQEAIRRVRTWLKQPGVSLLQPGPAHLDFLEKALAQVPGENLVTQAHLVALAMEYGAILHSTDAAFSRFEGVRWKNPLL